MKLKHIAIALVLATIPSLAFASGGDGPDVGTTNARIHIVVFGAKAPPPTSVTSDARIHIVVFGRTGDQDSDTGDRTTRYASPPRDRGTLTQIVSRAVSKVPSGAVRTAVAGLLRLAF
ncbi:MAG: hypothetical protein F4Y16_11880 [Holophagales bacterium]|nr:hypothetical protein [Holophagales bacterium]MYH24017.1 hypothetical protein [Holophagales bacterium]